MRILYLLSGINERLGRHLLLHLSNEFELKTAHFVLDDEKSALTSDVPLDVVTKSHLSKFDVVYIEGGWGFHGHPETRISIDALTDFVAHGGQCVISDVNQMVAVSNQKLLQQIVHLTSALPEYEFPDDPNSARYFFDELAYENGAFQFPADNMGVEEWPQAALAGIDSLRVGAPAVLLTGSARWAATSTSFSKVLALDLFVASPPVRAWASVSDYGRGHALLIAGNFSHDVIQTACPDNARWLSSMMRAMVDRSRENQQWAGERLDQDFDFKALLKSEESHTLERKSSFWYDVKLKEPKKERLHDVARAMAALMNADGGFVIVGQDDDGSIVGLEHDVRIKRTRDQFERAFVQDLETAFNKTSYALLNVKHYLETCEGKLIVILNCPKSNRPVWVSKESRLAFYIRRGNASVELHGQDLVDYCQKRFPN